MSAARGTAGLWSLFLHSDDQSVVEQAKGFLLLLYSKAYYAPGSRLEDAQRSEVDRRSVSRCAGTLASTLGRTRYSNLSSGLWPLQGWWHGVPISALRQHGHPVGENPQGHAEDVESVQEKSQQ